MKSFITSLFQDKDGSISSKRMVMFFLVFTFIFDCFRDMFTGHSMNASLVASLVALIYYSYGGVYAENITKIFDGKKDKEETKTTEQDFQQKPPTIIQ